jgi:hypothetical protein
VLNFDFQPMPWRKSTCIGLVVRADLDTIRPSINLITFEDRFSLHYRIQQKLATAPRTIAHSKSDRSIIGKSIFSNFLIYRTKKLGGSKRPGVNSPDLYYVPITRVPDFRRGYDTISIYSFSQYVISSLSIFSSFLIRSVRDSPVS